MALGLPSKMPGGPATIKELLTAGERSFSFEFFPPKTDAGEAQLWQVVRELEALRPTFVSMTYGAGGTTRDRTVRLTGRISAETTLTAVGHLTCVGTSRSQLRAVVGEYADAGVRNVLALRGDPPGGPTMPWVRHPDGLDNAVELVRLVRELGDFCVGVAAFPERHPESPGLDHDARVLAMKADAGAEFAITQFFFRARDYVDLVDRAARHGCHIPIIPGIMPVTNLSQIKRFAELSGAEVPAELVQRLESLGDDPDAVAAAGVEEATVLCEELLSHGAPGLHFYTLNRSPATRQIYRSLAGASATPR